MIVQWRAVSTAAGKYAPSMAIAVHGDEVGVARARLRGSGVRTAMLRKCAAI